MDDFQVTIEIFLNAPISLEIESHLAKYLGNRSCLFIIDDFILGKNLNMMILVDDNF